MAQGSVKRVGGGGLGTIAKGGLAEGVLKRGVASPEEAISTWSAGGCYWSGKERGSGSRGGREGLRPRGRRVVVAARVCGRMCAGAGGMNYGGRVNWSRRVGWSGRR